jgi:fructokinase
LIVVGGEALVDLLIGPDRGITATPGGGPFNTARTIGRLGLPVTFLGRLSTDSFGRSMATMLADDGVVLAPPDPVDDPTTLAVAELDDEGRAEYRFYLAGTSSIALRAEDTRSIRELHPAAIHVGTLGLVVEPIAPTLEAFVASASDEAVVMVDPNCRPSAIADPGAFRARIARVLRRADVVKVSHEDLAYLDPGRPTADAARAMLGSGTSAPSVVLVTNQSAAAVIHTRQDEIRVDVPRVEVVDTVGAGDAFGGAFLAWWVASGLGRGDLQDPVALRAAVEFAVGVAAMTCERAGADPPRFGELGELRARWPGRSEPPAA